MAKRTINRLSAVGIKQLNKHGLYPDGGNLYLQVTPAGVKSWLFRYMHHGKSHGMGLGPLHTVSLAEARAAAMELRRQLLNGIDPLAAKKAARAAAKIEAGKSVTFSKCAESVISAKRAEWSNPKHADQWKNTLDTYAAPIIGELPVSSIDTSLVMKVLEPIWNTKTETASRLRGRIETILDWAKVSGYRGGENPARWKGHLDQLLSKPSKVQRVKHHPALPYQDAPAFIQALKSQQSIASRAFAFLILTATRTSETIGARWEEIDMKEKIWTIPAKRMKAGKEHRVPLSNTAHSILKVMLPVSSVDSVRELHGGYIFPGQKPGTQLSNMALLTLLKRMERRDITAHGFRSTFRDWAGETTNHTREVVEAALAHTIKDKTEAAYARGDLFSKRAALMEDWSNFLFPKKRAKL